MILRAIGFYITKVFILLVGVAPFRVLHILSDLLFPLLWNVIRYRKEVVMINLAHSFPDMDVSDRKRIAKKFYRSFLDLTLETFKAQTISPRKVRKHVSLENQDMLNELLDKKGNVILLLAHYNNWELFGQRFSLEPGFIFRPVYKPLNNPYFDRMMYNVRARFKAEPMEIGGVLREMIRDRGRKAITGMVVDQKPIGDRVIWLQFLNQNTAAFRGAYVLAKRLGQPLVYTRIERRKRGYYNVRFELLTADPDRFSEQELAEMYFRCLADDIHSAPEYWLWTHRRWKRGLDHIYLKKPSNTK